MKTKLNLTRIHCFIAENLFRIGIITIKKTSQTGYVGPKMVQIAVNVEKNLIPTCQL